LIYEKPNVINFKIIYNQAILVDLYKYKHLIPVWLYQDHEHNTGYKQNVNICLLKCQKVFRQKRILYTGLDLCRWFNININQFDNLKSFKTYPKYMNFLKIIEL